MNQHALILEFPSSQETEIRANEIAELANLDTAIERAERDGIPFEQMVRAYRRNVIEAFNLLSELIADEENHPCRTLAGMRAITAASAATSNAGRNYLWLRGEVNKGVDHDF